MQSEKQPSYWAAGWATFAGLMLILIGIFHAISGLSEVVDPDAYVVSENYVFKLSSDAWGWTVGVIIAIISAAAAFAWLPFAPVSAIAIIAIDIAVIWALTAHGRDVTA